MGSLRDLLHLHELVIGNVAFISDSSVGKIAPQIFQACGKLEVCLPPLRLSSDLLAVCSQGLQKASTQFDGHSHYRSPTGLQSGGARMGTGWGPGWGPIGTTNRVCKIL